MDTIQECFNLISRGNKVQSSLAARKVRKLVYSSKGREDYQLLNDQIRNAPENYKRISEEWRQENFVMGISVMYFLHDRENLLPDFLFPWLLGLLQHPNGNIRFAAVRMLCHELGPLTVHIRFPKREYTLSGKITSEQADSILLNLFVELNNTLAELWKPMYKRYKYVSSLPTSPYKSVQMVMTRLVEICGTDYVDSIIKE